MNNSACCLEMSFILTLLADEISALTDSSISCGFIIVSLHSLCTSSILRGCRRGVMVKAIDCGIVVGEFVFQSRYYVQFRANTPGKGMNPLILPAMG